MRLLTLLLLLGVIIAPVCAQTAPPVDPKIVLKISLANNQREFRIGETIPLQLSFSSAVKDRYRINMAQYDRSGRMDYEEFVLTPAEGAVDPFPNRIGSLGGLTSFKFLDAEPWTLNLNLNEWVRFTQPGEYRLHIVSSRVTLREPGSSLGSAVRARSNEITLKIVAADPAWQKRVLSDAIRVLDQPAPANARQRDEFETQRRQAMQSLRFLETADAAREMAKRLRGEDSGLDGISSFGLRSTPERVAARSALQEALADPDHPIDWHFLYTLRAVNSDSDAENANWQESRQRAVEQLIAALNVKRGKALSISLNTAVNEAWNSTTLPRETTDKLVGQLIAMFDQLPAQEQNALLTERWDKISNAALLPLLQRHAQRVPEKNDANISDLQQLSASALRRWYELDPVGARPAFINEISRPRPRFDARLLGILPDETLPEVDFTLAENFSGSVEFIESSNIASLIARYATVAILPQVVEKLDPQIGKYACGIQNPLLAYVLRVNGASARPRIERAIAARGQGFTRCNHALFTDVAVLHYDPVLEEIAIRSLDDPDPEVAANAATALGNFGSPAAESALWQRYASWSTKWAGNPELGRMWLDRLDDETYQLVLGRNLVQALATGKSWLTDKNKLQRLAQMTKVRNVREQIDSYVKNWPDETVTISIQNGASRTRFYVRLAQYEFQSMKALQDKLRQFSSATKFSLPTPEPQSPVTDQLVIELRAFLSAQGFESVKTGPLE